MSFSTYSEFRQEIERELDLEEEQFVQPLELIGYTNQAIKSAARIINKLGEDYFLDYEWLTLVSSQAEYSFPADTFADKLRALVYSNGTRIYPIKRKRYTKTFVEIEEDALLSNTSTELQYLPINDATAGLKLTFFPTPMESGQYVKVWYLRKPNQIPMNTVTAQATVLDLPEAHEYMKAFVAWKVKTKESHPDAAAAKAAVEEEERELIETLTSRIPDGDTEVEADTGHYEEHT